MSWCASEEVVEEVRGLLGYRLRQLDSPMVRVTPRRRVVNREVLFNCVASRLRPMRGLTRSYGYTVRESGLLSRCGLSAEIKRRFCFVAKPGQDLTSGSEVLPTDWEDCPRTSKHSSPDPHGLTGYSIPPGHRGSDVVQVADDWDEACYECAGFP